MTEKLVMEDSVSDESRADDVDDDFCYSVITTSVLHNVHHEDARVDAFLRHMREREMETARIALAQLTQSTDYELREEEAPATEKDRLSDVKVWTENQLPCGNIAHIRKFSIKIVGPQKNEESGSNETKPAHYTLTYVDSVDSEDEFDSIERELEREEYKKDRRRQMYFVIGYMLYMSINVAYLLYID